ncbi:sugar phosphate isomerase/epimerase family protein [Brachybacterium alimentarium]|uniref:sugar phosphate isomerase/epimerase family protein n=1 Tax=Brachybacterium alimentarium TaxID=47845 RepID=UPI003FCFABCF
MIRPGLCSVTLRALSPAEVAHRAADAGLQAIEWGGDVHVPAGDPRRGEEVRTLTANAGLDVASYGSYFHGTGERSAVSIEIAEMVASALALGAPRIRVWAGTTGSKESTPQERERVVNSLREMAERAGEHGLEVGLEFHRATLTDTARSTLALLEEVGHPGVSTYWQPPKGLPDAEALATLDLVLARISTVHVFSWWPMGQRLRLAERADLWTAVLARLAATGRPRDALLEFVPGDDPDLLPVEAETLRGLLASADRDGTS